MTCWTWKAFGEGYFPPGSFNCLSRLWLSSCSKLKNIFPSKIITQLSNLQFLTVESCSALEEVICEEAIGVKSDCVLPGLWSLKLQFLPALVGILKGHLLNCPFLEEIEVVECPNLKRLPISISNAPNLRRIYCKREWWNELEWDDNAIKLQLEPLLIWGRTKRWYGFLTSKLGVQKPRSSSSSCKFQLPWAQLKHSRQPV